MENIIFFITFLSKATLYGANMYPYGPQQSDTEFNVEDTLYYWQCPEVKTDQTGFPFFGKRHYKLYVRIYSLPDDSHF